MPQNLDFVLYFNIAFFAIIGLGFVIGYFRGLRKSLYALIVTVLFYGLFFITINEVVNQLWILPIPFAFAQLGSFLPELTSAQTIGDAVFIMLEANLPATLTDTMSNAQFVAFVTGIALFAVKLVYTILYFTVGQVIFKFIFMIIRLMFFSKNQAMDDYKFAKRQVRKQKLKNRDLKRMKKEVRLEYKKMSSKEKRQLAKIERKKKKKKRKKNDFFDNRELLQHLTKPSRRPYTGALAGAAKGAVSAFVTLIILGGMVNIMDSLLQVLPEDSPTVSRETIELIYLSNTPVDTAVQPVELASPFEVPAELDAQIDMAREMVSAFNLNMFVSYASQITYTSEDYDGEIPLHLFLFDSVLSFTFEDENIMLRNELDVISDTAAILLDSTYFETNNISDITSDEIIALFNTLSQSKLITTLLPLGIEVGSDMFDTPIEIPVDELYDIDWESELQTLGAVAAVGFDLINAAGILNDEIDLTTVTLDGSEVRGLFDSLADSELATLGAYVAVAPLLEQMGGTISAIITVPDDIVWEDEFSAFGLVAEAILDTGISMSDLQSGDPTILIGALADLDFTVLLNSVIVTNALINVFSGQAGIEGLDMIVIPDGINWLDLFDDDGNLISNGELYNILMAINSITDVAADFDLSNLSLNVIADFDSDTIDSMFNSLVLVATISNFILTMDLGDTPLIIPDSVLDINGYITSTELKAVANSARVLVSDLACDEGDTVCEETGFDIAKAFSLSDTAIDTLTSSDILGATIGNLILDNGGDILTVPASALQTISVDSVEQDVVSKDEIRNLFLAVGVLGFTDLDNMTFDASIINNLGMELEPTTLDTDKSDKLFASAIVHATLSTMLFDQTSGVDSVLAVPYFAEDGLTAIRVFDTEDNIEYISLAELENILQALITINITDFTAIDSLDLNLIIDNSDILLDSAILQATISKQVLDLGTGVVTVPYLDQDGNDVRISVGSSVDLTETEYILKAELTSILDALSILGVADINNFGGDVDMAAITSGEGNIETLLASATIHATISKQLLDLDTGGTISVPFVEEDGVTDVRITVGTVGFETEYISKDEIRAMIDVLNILGITDNIDTFDGNVDMASITSDPANVDTLLLSATIQATISQQLLDLDTAGTLAIPYVEDDNTTAVRVTVGPVGFETEYITAAEIRAMIDALDVLGITEDINTFDGNVDMASITSDPANIDILLTSATIQATISKQLIDLDVAGTLALPYVADDDTTLIRLSVGAVGFETEYISKDEIKAMIDALDVLGITSDINTFDGNVDMASITQTPGNIDILLASATIQATISQQLIDLDVAGTLALPYVADDDTTMIRLTVGAVGFETEYISKDEIKAMIDALDVLGITDDINTFDGNVDMASITSTPGNIDILLASATIQATISQQLIDLDIAGTLALPYVADDDTTLVRLTVGTVGLETEYISKDEIKAMIDALDVLGITSDINTFDGNVDMASITQDPGNIDILLASATIQATISQQLIDLDVAGTLALPYYQDDNTTMVRLYVGTLGFETEYISKDEIKALVDALNVLGITDDINTFDGNVDMASITQDPGNIDILLTSATIQATISQQLIDLDVAGTLALPFYEDDNSTPIRLTVGLGLEETVYVTKLEIKALVDALDILGLTSDINSFDGGIDIASITAVPGNLAIMLNSSTIQATISEQLIDLDVAGTVELPFYKEDGVSVVRLTVGLGVEETEYIIKNEIENIVNALEILNITTDISSFNGSVDLSVLADGNNAADVLLSAMIQATVSKQVLDLVSDPGLTATFIVPFYKQDNSTLIRISVGNPVDSTDTNYVLAAELVDLIQGLDILGLTDVTGFNGDIDLNLFFDDISRGVLLESSIMQASISSQLIELGEATLHVPWEDINAIDIRVTVGAGLEETNYVTVDEISAIFEAFEVLNITNIGSFDGTIDISVLDNETKQDTLLASSSIHATISDLLIDLDDAVLIVPMYSQVGETLGNEIRLEVGPLGLETEFVIKGEIKSLINAFTTMGFTDLNNFGASLDSTQFFTGRATLLLSSSIQATISEKMISGTGGALIVPDVDVNDAGTIRLTHADGVTYIEIDELNAIFDGLEELGLQDFATMAFDLASILASDFNLVLTSASLQATISDNILASALDENDVYTGSALVVPTLLRQAIAVDSIASEHIEKVELNELLQAFQELGFTGFGDSLSGGSITSMTSGQLDEMFDSGSIHTTIDKMLRTNSSLSIPVDAEVDFAFISDITSEAEIRYFLTAVNTLGQGDFVSASFNVTAILALDAGQRSTVADSMIVRNTLHTGVLGVYSMATAPWPVVNTPFRALVAGDFMSGVLEVDANTSFFTKATFLEVVEYDYS